MRRVLVLWLPAFRLERCGIEARAVAALVGEVKGAVRLVAVTPGALESGLRVGMTATEARGLVPEVQLLPEDPPGEGDDRRALVRALEVVSDRVGVLAPDVLVLDLSHTRKAHGGELPAAERAAGLLESFGHQVVGVVADDARVARALTWRGQRVTVVPPGAGAERLARLPIEALEPEPELLRALVAVGVETVGAFAALDPASVVGRYGVEAGKLHHAARGLPERTGAAVELVEGELPAVKTAMAGATTRAELAFALPGLLSVLCERLEELDLAVVRLRIVLWWDTPIDAGGAEGASSTAASVRIGRPTRSPKALDRLVRARLDRLDLAPAPDQPPIPIEELQLVVEEAAPELGWQPGLADRAEGGEPLPDLLSRLSDQLGEEAVFSPVLHDTWRPEKAWRPGPPVPSRIAPRRAPRGRAPKEDDPVALLEAHEHGHPLPRPSHLLTRPQPVDVACDEGAAPGPVRVRFDTSWRPVTRRAGPERLQGEWWERVPLDREYWSVEVDGRCAWLFRDEGGWALHGWFD